MPRRKATLPLNLDHVDEATNLQMNQLAELLVRQYKQNGSSSLFEGYDQKIPGDLHVSRDRPFP